MSLFDRGIVGSGNWKRFRRRLPQHNRTPAIKMTETIDKMITAVSSPRFNFCPEAPVVESGVVSKRLESCVETSAPVIAGV